MIEQVKQLIDKSSFPVLYAGHGCTLYRVRFERFVDELSIPVMLSWRAIDLLPDDHPLFTGRPGLIAQPDANKRLWDADLVLILTEWDAVKQMDLQKLKSMMACPVVVDGRNVFKPEAMRAAGFTYLSVGRD